MVISRYDYVGRVAPVDEADRHMIDGEDGILTPALWALGDRNNMSTSHPAICCLVG